MDPGAGQGVLNAMISGSKAAKYISMCLIDIKRSAKYIIEYDVWFADYFESKFDILRNSYKKLGFNVN